MVLDIHETTSYRVIVVVLNCKNFLVYEESIRQLTSSGSCWHLFSLTHLFASVRYCPLSNFYEDSQKSFLAIIQTVSRLIPICFGVSLFKTLWLNVNSLLDNVAEPKGSDMSKLLKSFHNLGNCLVNNVALALFTTRSIDDRSLEKRNRAMVLNRQLFIYLFGYRVVSIINDFLSWHKMNRKY